MMKLNFREKTKELIKELPICIEKECLRLYESGGIDPSSYENNYLLPKIILSVALQNQVCQYKPLSPEGKKEFNNLTHY